MKYLFTLALLGFCALVLFTIICVWAVFFGDDDYIGDYIDEQTVIKPGIDYDLDKIYYGGGILMS